MLFARAAAGVCDDSLLALRREIETLLESYSQPVSRSGFRRDLLTRPMSLAFPCLGVRAFGDLPSRLPLDAAQRAVARGDRRHAVAIIDSQEVVRRVIAPGDVALDFVVLEAQLRASIGDTTAAIGQLDRVLRALPTLSQFVFREEAQAAAFGRSLALRAELARATGDTAEQRLRARQALLVWRHADPSLGPAVDRLRALSIPVR